MWIIVKILIFGDRLMCRFCVLIFIFLILIVCVEYWFLEVECFNFFVEVSCSNCNFELFGLIGLLYE